MFPIVVSVLFVCCLIVVPLPPGENPFAVNNNNNNNNKNHLFNITLKKVQKHLPHYISYLAVYFFIGGVGLSP
jgi:hypothetical protein